eukprot:14136890-Ditylum_brightwellii.AAC.1
MQKICASMKILNCVHSISAMCAKVLYIYFVALLIRRLMSAVVSGTHQNVLQSPTIARSNVALVVVMGMKGSHQNSALTMVRRDLRSVHLLTQQ